MSKINDGGLAFGEFHKAGDLEARSGGMSLRDYFAAKAMQGVCSEAGKGSILDIVNGADRCAELSFIIADAMLSARKVSK